jgi:hypothetical protein
MPGCLDSLSTAGMRGWYWQPGSRAALQVNVNGQPFACVLCGDARADVLAAGISPDGRVGFELAASFAGTDVIRLLTIDGGETLAGTPRLCATGMLLPAAAAHDNPELVAVRALFEHYPVQAFYPFWGGSGLSAVAIQCSGAEPVRELQQERQQELQQEPQQEPQHGQSPLMLINFAPNARAVQRLLYLHQQLLAPAAVCAPLLRGCKPGPAGRYLLEFDYFPGALLGKLPMAQQRVYLPQILAELLRLPVRVNQYVHPHAHQHLRPSRRGRWPGRGKAPHLHAVLKTALVAIVRCRHGRAEARFLLRLLAVVARLPRVFSHGDLHTLNVLVDIRHSTFMFIDWDRCGYWPLGYDTACLLRGTSCADIAALWGALEANAALNACLSAAGQGAVAGAWLRDALLGTLCFRYLLNSADIAGYAHSIEADQLRSMIRALLR